MIQRLGWKGPTDLKREDWGPYLPFISDICTVQNGRHLKAWWFTICHTATPAQVEDGLGAHFFRVIWPRGWGELERKKRDFQMFGASKCPYIWGCRWEMFFSILPAKLILQTCWPTKRVRATNQKSNNKNWDICCATWRNLLCFTPTVRFPTLNL